MDKNTLTVASTFEIDDDDKTHYENDVATLFTRNGDQYHYNGAPNPVAFTDHGSSITSEYDNDEIAHAMTMLAVSKGWETYKTAGTDHFYGEVEKRSAELLKERQTNTIENATNTNTNADVKTAYSPASDVVTTDTLAKDDERKQRIDMLQKLHEQYRVNGNRYYIKDARDSSTLAFKDKGDKLTTGLNTERVARSMVGIAAVRGWQSIKVSGAKQFKRQVWIEAQSHGLSVSGYKPTPDEVQLYVKAEKLNTVENAQAASNTKPANDSTNKPKADTQTSTPATRNHSGVLIAHGAAPYKNDPKASASYYATVQTVDDKQRTIWGKDLQRAISESFVTTGQRVDLEYVGNKPVTVDVQEKNKDGESVTKTIETVRNTWKVKAQVIEAVATAVVNDRIADHESREKTITAINKRVNTHKNDLPDVDMHTNTQQTPTRKTGKGLSR